MLFKTHTLINLPIQNPLQTTIRKITWSGYKLRNIFELILPLFICTGGISPVFIYLLI